MARRLFITFAFALALWGGTSATAQELPTLTVVWLDSHRQFPATGLPALRRELEELFASHGMSVRLHVAEPGDNLAVVPRPRINTVVIPSDGANWGLHRDAMAAAVGEKGRRYNIFVFYPGVRRTLGHDHADFSPFQLAEISRAMARILAHELVHVLAPERGHAGSGLMSEQLKRRHLVGRHLELDPTSLLAARARLTQWARLETPVVALDSMDAASLEKRAGAFLPRPPCL